MFKPKLLLASALIFTSFVCADQVNVGVGVRVHEGHHERRSDRIVVVEHPRHHGWHHRHWHHVVLEERFVTTLGPSDNAGPDYRFVDVYFEGGRVCRRAYVYYDGQVELPSRYAGGRIVKVVVVQ